MLHQLPSDLVQRLLSFVPSRDLFRLQSTSKRLREEMRHASASILCDATVDLRLVGFDDTSIPRVVLVFTRPLLIDAHTGQAEETIFCVMDDNEDFLVRCLSNLLLCPFFSALHHSKNTQIFFRLRDSSLPPSLVLLLISTLESTLPQISHLELQGTDLPPDATSVVVSFLDAYGVQSISIEDLTHNRKWMKSEFWEAIQSIDCLMLGRPPSLYHGKNAFDFDGIVDVHAANLVLVDVCVHFFGRLVEDWAKGRRPWTRTMSLDARMDDVIALDLVSLLRSLGAALESDTVMDNEQLEGSLPGPNDREAKVFVEISPFHSIFSFRLR